VTTSPDPAAAAVAAAEAEPLSEMRGLHAGLIVLAGVAVANAGNYAFHLLAAHLLGPASYGGVVSLLTLSGLISLPLAGVQIGIARNVAAHEARGEREAVGRVLSRGLVLALGVGTTIALAMIALLPAIERLLDVGSTSAIVLTALLTIPGVAMPVVWGVVQGLQRYKLLALSMALGTMLKTALFLALFMLGGELTGAILATLLAGAIAVVVTVWPIRGTYRAPTAVLADTRAGIVELLPVVGGLLAITSLTSIDVVVAKSVLSSHDAGVYAGASLIGRVVLYLPAAISTVLLPKVTSRAHANRDTTDIVGASIAVTAAVCLTVTLLYALLSDELARGVLGTDFVEAAELLARFGFAMTLYAILNVLLVYHLGHSSAKMTVLLAFGAVLQLAGYVVFHDSGLELLAVSIAVGLALIAAHELLIARSSKFVFAWLVAFGRLAARRGS
jgi:O-antigen/teichoic acid export membrane protein